MPSVLLVTCMFVDCCMLLPHSNRAGTLATKPGTIMAASDRFAFSVSYNSLACTPVAMMCTLAHTKHRKQAKRMCKASPEWSTKCARTFAQACALPHHTLTPTPYAPHTHQVIGRGGHGAMPHLAADPVVGGQKLWVLCRRN